MTRRDLRAAAAGIVIAGTLALTPTAAVALGRPCATADVRVAIVVDYGDASAVTAVCVPASSHDNGALLLGARATQLGTPPPRFAASGLLCAIDGVPETGCGEQSGGHYAYWSYWHGTDGTWAWSNAGPASLRVQTDTVEGWRFQPAGAGNPSDPPPRASASAAATCDPPTASTVAAATTPPGADPVPSPTTTLTSQTASPPPSAATGPNAPATAAPRSRSSSPSATTSAGTAGAPLPVPAGGTGSEGTIGASTAPATTSTGKAISERNIARRAVPTGGGGNGNTPVGVIVAIALVAALASAGALATRRRGMTRR